MGNNKASLSAVDRADTTSWKYNRPCGVALGLQASETNVDPHSGERTNVFSNDPSGSDFANNSKHLEPEAGTLSGKALLLSGLADVLA